LSVFAQPILQFAEPGAPVTHSNDPYSLVTEKHGIVYVSGVATVDYQTLLPIPGDEAGLAAALDEVERRLQSIGLRLNDVTKVTYYICDMRLRPLVNAPFELRFSAPRPARTVVGVASVPYGGSAIIDAIAHRP
jgi:2-iminobutanoate/2-iminopropanoate deaminase